MEPVLANAVLDGIKEWVTPIVAVLWLVYLWRENFGRKPTLAEEMKALAESTSKELKRLAEETSSEMKALAEQTAKDMRQRVTREEIAVLERGLISKVEKVERDGDSRARENRERSDRFETLVTAQGRQISAVETTAQLIHQSMVLLATKLDVAAEKAATALERSNHAQA